MGERKHIGGERKYVGRRQLRNTSGRDEEKEKGEDKKNAWKDGREEEVREYIVKKSEGR